MQSRLKRGYAAVAVVAVAVTLLIVSLSAPVISTTADFSIFNSGWNGTSEMAILTYRSGKFVPTFQLESTGTDVEIAQVSLEDLNLDPITSALIIVGPTKAFSDSEGALVGDFVRGGGRVLLADDFGTGNSLLQGMGATSRFSEDLMMDLAYEKQPEFTVLFNLRRDPLTTNVSTLLLNYPSSLSINPSTTEAVAYSSVASWLDTNGNRLQEWGEPKGPFPIAARETMGNGSIILLSDPSVLINGMRAYEDNARFGYNLVAEVSADRTAVLFDESHRTYFDPVTVTTEITGEVSTNAEVVLVVLALFFTLWIATDSVDRAFAWTLKKLRMTAAFLITVLRLDRWFGKPAEKPVHMSIEELLRKVSEEHPEWKPGLVRYIIKEEQRHSSLTEQKTSR